MGNTGRLEGRNKLDRSGWTLVALSEEASLAGESLTVHETRVVPRQAYEFNGGKDMATNAAQKRANVFQVIVLRIPTLKEIEECNKTAEIAYGPVAVVAGDENGASAKVMKSFGDKIDVPADQMEVRVVPFE